eukprot:s1992_g29.t1
MGSGNGLGRHWSSVAPRLFCVAGVALGDICLRFSVTYGAGLALVTALAGSGGGLGRRWSPVAPPLFCVASVALGDICLRFVWQAWRLATSAFVLCGKRGAYGTGLALVTALVAAGPCSAAPLLRGRRGAWLGVALGDICLRFALQAWHFGTRLALVAALVAAGSLWRRPSFAWQAWRLATSAFVFVWQAWHLVASAFVLCCRRGTYGIGLALVMALVAGGPLWRWQMSPSADVAKRHACHAKDARRHRGPAETKAVSATLATQNEGRCYQAPRLPHKIRQARRHRGPQATKAITRANPVPSPSATPATQNEGRCYHAPRLTRKRSAAPQGTSGDQGRHPARGKRDVTKCHACHTKRRQMSPSATPSATTATQKRRAGTRPVSLVN